MTRNIQIILYSTDYCSLCDEALELLLSMPELAGGELSVVDVALDEALVQRYAERLPVLAVRCAAGEGELDWPFDAAAVSRLVRQFE